MELEYSLDGRWLWEAQYLVRYAGHGIEVEVASQLSVCIVPQIIRVTTNFWEISMVFQEGNSEFSVWIL